MTHGSGALQADKVVQLERLDLGTFDVGPGLRLIPVSGWLITTGSGRRMLLDTGFPPGYAVNGHAMAAADGLDRFGRLVGFGPHQTILGALALRGLTAGAISHVLLSHSHIDHIGGLPGFPNAEIILGATERALPRPLYFGTARPMPWPDARYRSLTATTDICHGLRMIATPGHTAGHMSALVTLRSQTVVLAADAINRHSEPSEGYPDADDPVQAALSGNHLLQLAHRLGATLIPGHQPISGTLEKDLWQ